MWSSDKTIDNTVSVFIWKGCLKELDELEDTFCLVELFSEIIEDLQVVGCIFILDFVFRWTEVGGLGVDSVSSIFQVWNWKRNTIGLKKNGWKRLKRLNTIEWKVVEMSNQKTES